MLYPGGTISGVFRRSILDDFVEEHHIELRRHLNIKSVREFIEEAIRLHMDYSRRVLEKADEREKIREDNKEKIQ